MPNVINVYGVCEAETCKRPERAIVREEDSVVIGNKRYHRGCEPTVEEREARNRSSA